MKKYKPGQFVSIDGKLARVTQAKTQPTNPSCIFVCEECKVKNKKLSCFCHRINQCINTNECVNKLPHDCYPKLIKQCGNQAK